MKKRILLVGGNAKAQALAQSLLSKGFHVTALNSNYEDCLRFSAIDGLKVIQGDGTEPYVLEDLGAKDYDVAIALTPKDEDNLVICELCKRRFGIPKTVSLLADPLKSDFFHAMGVDRVVCAIVTITDIIETQAFVDKLSRVVSLEEGGLEVATVVLRDDSPATGVAFNKLDVPDGVVVGCIIRGNKALIPQGSIVLKSGDKVMLICEKHLEDMAVSTLAGEES